MSRLYAIPLIWLLLSLQCAPYAEAAPKNYGVEASASLNASVTLESDSGARALGCTPTMRSFTVQLEAPLAMHERIGLTGDAAALGDWQLARSVALEQQTPLEWRGTVLLQSCTAVFYRYFIYTEDEQQRRQIRRWETQLEPRQLSSCDANCRRVDRFGELGEVNRGWLTHETIVQLKFEREKLFQVLDIEKFATAEVRLRVVPLAADWQTPLSVENAAAKGLHVEAVTMGYGSSQLQTPPEEGVAYRRGDIVIFHLTLPHPADAVYALEVRTPAQALIAQAIIRAADLAGSEGVLELSLDEPHAAGAPLQTVARLTLPYVIVQPLAGARLDFRATYAHYWPSSWPNLDIGHRGNGKSYIAAPPPERENTIASFLSAYHSYADMIELDVHLTADGIPIIYHDFGIRTAATTVTVTSPEQLEYVLIKDITYEALKRSRVFAVIAGRAVEYPSHNAESRPEHRLFPTLLDILDGLPRSLGIDVEIKWPQRTECGGVEAVQTIDKNFFIDRILADIIDHGCGRPLIFSSFDADICLMLRFKQNIFPVMMLTQGETKKWPYFMDLRTRTFVQAVNNAQAFELAGTAPHADDFLGAQGAELMQMARKLGQIVVVWGDAINSRERVQYFNEIGATATCYDRSDLYVPEGKTRSFFNSESLLAHFEAQCRP